MTKADKGSKGGWLEGEKEEGEMVWLPGKGKKESWKRGNLFASFICFDWYLTLPISGSSGCKDVVTR